MLDERPHGREEYLGAGARLFLEVGARLAQGFEVLDRPADFEGLYGSFRASAMAEGLGEGGNTRAFARGLDELFNRFGALCGAEVDFRAGFGGGHFRRALLEDFFAFACGLFEELFSEVGVVVGAHDRASARVDELLFARGSRGDGVLDHSSFERLYDSAGGLDFYEEFPRLAGELLSERFDEVRAARGVDDVGEVALFLQNYLLVARDSRREFIGLAHDFVERRHRHGVAAADYARERLRRRAQHVDVRVVDSLVVDGSLGVDADFAGLFRASEGLDDLRPQDARGPELCDRHEEIGVEAEPEPHEGGGFVYGHAAREHFAQVGGGGRHRGAKLFDGARARGGVGHGVHAYRPEGRHVLCVVGGQSEHFVERAFELAVELPALGEGPYRVEPYPAGELFALLRGVEDRRGSRRARSGGDVDFHAVGFNALQGFVKILFD